MQQPQKNTEDLYLATGLSRPNVNEQRFGILKHLRENTFVYCILILGVLGVIIIYIYLLSTNKVMDQFSDDPKDWHEMALFMATVFTPILTLLGAYYVKKTLDLQMESRYVDSYTKQMDNLLDDLRHAIREYDLFFIDSSDTNINKVSSGNDFNTKFCINLKEYIVFNQNTNRLKLHRMNKETLTVKKNDYNKTLQQFVLRKEIVEKSGNTFRFKKLRNVKDLSQNFIRVWILESYGWVEKKKEYKNLILLILFQNLLKL